MTGRRERRRNLTEDFDRWVGTLRGRRDSKTIYFSCGGHGSLARLRGSSRRDGGRRETKSLQDDERWCAATTMISLVTPDGKTLSVHAHVDHSAQRDLCQRIRLANGCPARTGEVDAGQRELFVEQRSSRSLTSTIRSSPKSTCQTYESFWFTGAHGDKVQGFLVKPPNFDPNKKYPVKFLIHGGPQGAWGDDWSLPLESRTVRRQRIRRHHDQLPRLDRLRAEVHRRDQRRLGRRSV